MKKIIFALSCFCLSILTAQKPFSIYPLSDFDYNLLEAWLTLQGKTSSSDAYPLSGAQIASTLEEAKQTNISNLFTTLQDKLALDTTEYSKGLNAVFDVDLALEMYLQSNLANLKREYDYQDRTAPISFNLQAYFIDHLQFFIDLDPKEEHTLDTSSYKNLLNVWTSLTDFDYELPHQAFASFGDINWYLVLGRDTLRWGPSRSGGLSLSDTPDYYDHLKGVLTWEAFTYTTIWIHLDPTINSKDSTTYPGIGGEIPVKNFFAHRLEFLPLENLSLSLIEEIIYGGKYPTLEVLNPVGIFHSTFDFANLNINLDLTAKWVPLPGLLVFGTFVADQVNGISEQGTTNIPSAIGYQGGLHYYLEMGNGFWMAGTEYSHTDPWMYMEHDTLTQFSSRRHVIAETLNCFIDIDQSIGFPFGPDANYWLNWIEYVQPGSWKAGISLSLLQKGDVDFSSKYEWSPENAAATTPSGPNPITRWSTELYGEYTWSGLTVKGRVYFLNFENYAHLAGNSVFDIQAALSAGWTFTF